MPLPEVIPFLDISLFGPKGDVLGSGTYGTVYEHSQLSPDLAEYGLTDKAYALKYQESGYDPLELDMFNSIAASYWLDGQEIVKVVAVATDESKTLSDRYVLVSRLARHLHVGALGVLLRENGDVAKLEKIAVDLARSLKSIHWSGIIHRDIKLDNALLVDQASDPVRAQWADLDLAWSLLCGHSQYLSQAVYTAPEQLLHFKTGKEEAETGYDDTRGLAARGYDDTRGLAARGYDDTRGLAARGYDDTRGLAARGYDEKVDVWSFGICLYRLFTGQDLFSEGRLIEYPSPSMGLKEGGDIVTEEPISGQVYELTDADVWIEMVQLSGMPDVSFLRQTHYYDDPRELDRVVVPPGPSIEDRTRDLPPNVAKAIKGCLILDPRERKGLDWVLATLQGQKPPPHRYDLCRDIVKARDMGKHKPQNMGPGRRFVALVDWIAAVFTAMNIDVTLMPLAIRYYLTISPGPDARDDWQRLAQASIYIASFFDTYSVFVRDLEYTAQGTKFDAQLKSLFEFLGGRLALTSFYDYYRMDYGLHQTREEIEYATRVGVLLLAFDLGKDYTDSELAQIVAGQGSSLNFPAAERQGNSLDSSAAEGRGLEPVQQALETYKDYSIWKTLKLDYETVVDILLSE